VSTDVGPTLSAQTVRDAAAPAQATQRRGDGDAHGHRLCRGPSSSRPEEEATARIVTRGAGASA
jgi:hypothetical protein